MQVYINFGFIDIPSYGAMITLGVILANTFGIYLLRKAHLDFNDLIILEAYCFLGAFIGAKGLYLLISAREIYWDKILDPDYFNAIMLSGFVFYGGLIGGLLFVCLAGKVHSIDAAKYARWYIAFIPFIHAFGRIGCFCAGCCYGKPYDGIGAVVFPEGSFAIPGVKLFPVQLVEAFMLLCISFIILYMQLKKKFYYTIELYLILYAITRFVLEYFRYDEIRGRFWGFSTSQWISVALAGASVFMLYRAKNGNRESCWL